MSQGAQVPGVSTTSLWPEIYVLGCGRDFRKRSVTEILILLNPGRLEKDQGDLQQMGYQFFGR